MAKKLRKSDLQDRIDELEGTVLALQEKIELLTEDLHQSRNPYQRAKPGTPEWHDYAKKLVKQINIYT